jgi:hypothetical protein
MEEPEPDEIDGKAWFVDLLLWRPSRLTDEEMQLHFDRWDGGWSDQTKRAMEQHGAKGLGCSRADTLQATLTRARAMMIPSVPAKPAGLFCDLPFGGLL